MSYLEDMRKKHCRSGPCQLSNVYCETLERHHECYDPERVIYVSHEKHHMIHFLWWYLTSAEKMKLLRCRLGPNAKITDEMISKYRPPKREVT